MRTRLAAAVMAFWALMCVPSGAQSPVPTATAVPTETPVPEVLTHVEGQGRVVALTLDDGYRPDPALLDYLEASGLHGTAFLVGEVADDDPAFVRRVEAMGWMVCSHSYEHEHLPSLSITEIRDQIVRGADAVADVVGYRCPYFRAPFGATDARVRAVVDELGLQLVGWNASLSDSSPGVAASAQLEVAYKDLQPGSILLGHYGGNNSLEVLSSVVRFLEEGGYRIGSVSELLDGTIAAAPAPGAAPTIAPSTPFVRTRAPRGTPGRESLDWARLATVSIPGAIGVGLSGLFTTLARRSRRRRTEASTTKRYRRDVDLELVHSAPMRPPDWTRA